MATVGNVFWAEERAIVGDMRYADTQTGFLMLYFQTPADTIYPQIIIAQEELVVDGVAAVRLTVARPWNVMPQADNTYAAKILSSLVLRTLTVIPKAITDFGSLPGLT